MKKLLLVLMLVVSCLVCGQTAKPGTIKVSKKTGDIPMQNGEAVLVSKDFAYLNGGSASFPGGVVALETYMRDIFQVSADTISKYGGTTIMSISFIIEATGTIQDIRIKKGPCASCNAIAIDAIKKMPRWDGSGRGFSFIEIMFPLNF